MRELTASSGASDWRLLSPRFCRADLGWSLYFGPANFKGKLPTNFSSNFDGENVPWFFRPCFSRISGPPKIHAQNCRHSSPISLSRTQICSPWFSACWGDQRLAIDDLAHIRIRGALSPTPLEESAKWVLSVRFLPERSVRCKFSSLHFFKELQRFFEIGLNWLKNWLRWVEIG